MMQHKFFMFELNFISSYFIWNQYSSIDASEQHSKEDEASLFEFSMNY